MSAFAPSCHLTLSGRETHRYEWLDGERECVAREGTGARYVGFVYAQHLKRSAGMMLAMLPIIGVILALPQNPDGPIQP